MTTPNLFITSVRDAAEVDAVFERRSAKNVTVVATPHDAPFGRTFVVADPDGNRLRVAFVD